MAVSTSQTTLNEESKNASDCAYLREQRELVQSNLEATVQRLDDGEDVYEIIEGIEGQLASINASLAANCGGGQVAVSTSQTTSNEESKNASHCAYLREQKELTQSNLEATVQRLDDGEDVYEIIEGIEGQLASIDASLAADCGGGQGSTNGGAASSDPGEGPQSGPYIWKQEGGTGGGSSHRSLMGANLDIVQALDLVEFQRDGTAPMGEGPGSEMRNATAYIRRWKRANTSQQSQVSPDNVSDVVDLGNADTVNAIVANSWTQPSLLNGPALPNFNAEAYNFDTIESQTNAFNTAEIWNSDVINNNITGQDWSKLSQEVPTNAFIESNSSPTAEAPATPTPVSTAQTNPAPGKVISANPGGGGNNGFLSRLTRNLLNIASPSPIYSGAFTDQKAKTSTLQEGVWQFLFNPSELQLRAGPEYAKAQVWGVSDKANSGQPRHWTNNRNPELKFNKVLLNGYVFGRQVEELEQGLFDLFMSRDGGGQDGPDVLEFVWGKRVFGPCIIKDIEVTEKAWDNGLVVNAEVSFTLEQIPEWTINDGAVSVYNPSQLPLSQQTPNIGAGTTATDDNGKDGGGGGESPDQKGKKPNPNPPSGDAKLCDFALKISKKFQQLYVRVDNPLTAAAFGNFNGQVSQFYSLKGSLYSGSKEIGEFVDTKVSSGCKKSSYKATVEDIKKSGGTAIVSPQQQAIQFIRGCTESTKRAIDEWHRTSPKCKPQRTAGEKGRAEQKIKDKQKQECAKYTGGCNTPGAEFGTAGQCPHINGGRGVKCSGGVWTAI